MRRGSVWYGCWRRCNRGNTKNRHVSRIDAMFSTHQSTGFGLQQIAIAVCAAICSHACAQAPAASPAAIMPQPVAQPNGDFTVMPQNLPGSPPVSRRTGLNLYVDTRWVNAYGYRPVEVTISSPLPTT